MNFNCFAYFCNMSEEIINKVAKANIIQLDLGTFMPDQTIMEFDMKQALWQEMVVKESVFRDYIKTFNWSVFKDKTVGVYCSIEAIIPAWAYMLVTTHLKLVNATIYYGSKNEVIAQLFFNKIKTLNVSEYINQRVMVKGCSNIPTPNKAYLELTKVLVPHVKSLMFGEPCSAVPVFKRK